ncbi:MAG TPA: response regulator [Terriglobales bacterium]|nr:response regulator [Terriglobales bacterium]
MRRILLVDDELAILLTLKAVLELNGFEVETAASSGEAMKLIQSKTYDMVITDMRMETENAGYDVIRTARQQPYDPATAILTAFPALGSEWESKGAQSLLVKPVGTEELLRQLDQLLTRHEAQRLREQKGSARAASVQAKSGDHSRRAS